MKGEPMGEESMQEMVLRAHVVLHPEGDAIAELLASGVGTQRVLALYPFSFAEWAPALILRFNAVEKTSTANPAYPTPMDAIWRGVIVRDQQLHAQLIGIDSLTWKILNYNEIVSQFSAKETEAFIQSEVGVELLRAMGYRAYQGRVNSLDALLGDFVTLSEILQIALNWPRLVDAHRVEERYREAVVATLHLLLPQEFPMDNPPVRNDTMMFEPRVEV